jgi:hypothetical protein
VIASRSKFIWIAAGLLAAATPREVRAQDTAAAAPPAATGAIGKVSVDLAAGAFDRALPFDVPFFITGRPPAGTTRVELQFAAVPESGDTSALVWVPQQPAQWQPQTPAADGDRFVLFVNRPLQPGRDYRMRFVLRNGDSLETTKFADGRTPEKNYFSLDVGVLFAGDISVGALYVGTNIYFRPINKDAPLNALTSFGRRLAVTVGVTVSSVSDENNRTRSDLFWNQSLVLGAGYRLTSSLRGGGGVLVFRQSDPNPLVTHQTAAATWYASFSVDLDVLRGIAR